MSQRNRIRVAIADDHSIVREGLKQILHEDPDIQVVAEACDSREALAAGRDANTNVLILDVAMPGRGGFDTLHQIRRHRPDLPVLMLSCYPEAELALRAFREGANGYLSKGRASSELRGAVHKISSGGKYITPATAERLAEQAGGHSAAQPHEGLTTLELQVLCLLAAGRTTAEIAGELDLSPKTISTYRKRILETMEMTSHAQIIHYALDHGLALPYGTFSEPDFAPGV